MTVPTADQIPHLSKLDSGRIRKIRPEKKFAKTKTRKEEVRNSLKQKSSFFTLGSFSANRERPLAKKSIRNDDTSKAELGAFSIFRISLPGKIVDKIRELGEMSGGILDQFLVGLFFGYLWLNWSEALWFVVNRVRPFCSDPCRLLSANECKTRRGSNNLSGQSLRWKWDWKRKIGTHVSCHRAENTRSPTSREIHGKTGQTVPRKQLLEITTATELHDYSRGGADGRACANRWRSRASAPDTNVEK